MNRAGPVICSSSQVVYTLAIYFLTSSSRVLMSRLSLSHSGCSSLEQIVSSLLTSWSIWLPIICLLITLHAYTFSLKCFKWQVLPSERFSVAVYHFVGAEGLSPRRLLQPHRFCHRICTGLDRLGGEGKLQSP